MEYSKIVEGIFIKRMNRFIAKVWIDGTIELVHVRNTGRCKELFIEGVRTYLEKSDNPERKTKYSLIAVYKGDMLINLDSQIPNAVVFDALKNDKIEAFKYSAILRREVVYGDSRFDCYYENGINKGFIEVKGVTLEDEGLALFPDAPTQRGVKHLDGLIQGQKEGYQNAIIFLIQMEGIRRFRPNSLRDPRFAQALLRAQEAGVKILVYNSIVTPSTITIGDKVEFMVKEQEIEDGY